MSRGRVSGAARLFAESEQSATQAWHGLVDTLRLLPSVGPSAAGRSMNDDELRLAENERRTLADAIDKVSGLIALRRAAPPAAPSPAPSVSTPSGGAGGGGSGAAGGGGGATLGSSLRAGSVGAGAGGSTGRGPSPVPDTALPLVSTPSSTAGGKRKRRPSVSVSGSPAPSIGPSAVLQAPHTGGSESALSSVPSPLPHGFGPRGTDAGSGGSNRSGTPSAKDAAAASARMKKEMYSTQLPLQPGRRIIVKEKRKGKNEGDEEGEELKWILGRIKKCIGMDKMRYEVQDEDDGTTWNTTLRFIIPLADPDASPTSPAHPSNLPEFPRGTKVLALYPDTTEFYAATVVAPPPGGRAGGARGAASGGGEGGKEGVYKLEFADDDGRVNEVNKDSIVLYPD